MDLTNLEKYLQDWGNEVVRLSKDELRDAKGNTRLGGSIRVEVRQEPNGIDVTFYMLDYGTFLDKGVSGNKVKRSFTNWQGKRRTSPYSYTTLQPPPDILSRWIKKKGIKPKGLGRGRDKNTGQYISNLAFLIGRKIKSRGIPSISFFQEPLGMKYSELQNEIATQFKEDVETYITTYTKF
ncbi:MAG: hypothetical protein Unbinned6316contig1000_5 [Prokaryotic dsDNA virus sp.]|nr:MAG: hypothetical protein Unbinned6316contig1000_5 [Prokaryotic dsDNA virus sp.]|tara:strand:- start:5651 stop:6193 length:543 start_codon:yes stop_codon:yes gene_type:complete